MWKKLFSILVIEALVVLLGFYLNSSNNVNDVAKKYESTLDSLNTLRVSIESKEDSLFSLRAECDSLTKIKIREVAKYDFTTSTKYLKEAIKVDSVATEVRGDTDSVVILRTPELQKVNTQLAKLSGLSKRDSINQELLAVKDSVIKNQDEVISLQELIIRQQQEHWKAEKKKGRWKIFGIGVSVGALIAAWTL